MYIAVLLIYKLIFFVAVESSLLSTEQ